MVKVGSKVKDILTGFAGTVIGRTEWLTGCATIGIQPEETKDGAMAKTEWLDENRVKVLADAKEGQYTAPEAKKSAKKVVGGPHDAPRRNLAPAGRADRG